MFSEETGKPLRVQDLTGESARVKQFLPHLQRARSDAIVEFVSSGSRMRVYVMKESAVLTFLLGAINCPRGARIGPAGKMIGETEPFAEDALNFTKQHVLQHDVQIEVDGMDKAGGLIGSLFVKTDKGWSNFAEQLLEQGYATVHFTAEKSKYYHKLLAAEKIAKDERRNLWKDYVEEEQVDKPAANEPAERKLNLKKVLASEVYKGNLHFAAQSFVDGPTIETLMEQLQGQLNVNSSTNYTPRRNELCACFDVNLKLWHRAKVESVKGGRADVLYIDFGNVSVKF
jgi:staphylococcal nuclease domain-containing protein 1